MKPILSLLLFIPTLAFGAVDLSCSTLDTMKTYLEKSQESIVFIGERPVTIGKKTSAVTIVITLNKESGAWTEFAIAPDKIVCLIGDGKKGTLLNKLVINS